MADVAAIPPTTPKEGKGSGRRSQKNNNGGGRGGGNNQQSGGGRGKNGNNNHSGGGRGGGRNRHPPQGEPWACTICTYVNQPSFHTCEICGVGSRPSSAVAGPPSTPESARQPQQQRSFSDDALSPSPAGGSGGGRSSRRGRDASHLLNFQPLQRQEETTSAAPPPRRMPSKQTSVRQKHEDKLQFLQAKFHLLVAPGGDYRANKLDPDYPLDWDCVRAVRFVTSDQIRCPICLVDPPLAPQIYSCGHVMCLPCALRFHTSCEEAGTASRCPLCAETVSLKDLRSVCLREVAPTRVSATTPVAFSKVHTQCHDDTLAATAPTVEAALSSATKLFGFTAVRSCNSLCDSQLAELSAAKVEARSAAAAANVVDVSEPPPPPPPVTTVVSASETSPPKVGGGGGGRWGGERSAAQILRGPQPAVTEQSSREDKNATAAMLSAASADCSEELCFLDQAEALVRQRKADWAVADQQHLAAAVPSSPIHGASASPPADSNAAATSPGGAEEDNNTRLVLQASDGQLVFADNLSTRLLLEQFQSWAAVPETISAPIVELASHRHSEEGTRKRFKSLSHLPTACTFSVAELDLSGIVSPEVLQHSSDQLAKRAERRQKKLEEEKREEKAQREKEKEARRHGRSALAFELEMISLDEAEAARRRQQLATDAPAIEVAPEWQEQWQQQQQSQASRQLPSFATMALKGFAATRPALSSSLSPELGPSR